MIILPNVILHYKSGHNFDKYAGRIDEDYQMCLERAKENSMEIKWCSEIERTSNTNLYSNNNSLDIYLMLTIFQPALFILMISVIHLRRQIEELKEKLNA